MKRISPEEIKRAAYERNKLFGENDVLAYTRKPDADECIAQAQLKSCEAELQKMIEWLEKYVWYVDGRGYQALRPHATENYQAFKKERGLK